MSNINFLYPFLKFDALSNFIGLFVVIFTILILIYSVKFMKGIRGIGRYYLYIVLTFISSLGVALANNLIILLVFWGFLGLTLYILINIRQTDESAATAKKSLIIIGGSDSLMILGLGIIYCLAGTFQMDRIHLAVDGSPLAVLAFLCLAVGCFAKAGAMPFHSWIPDCARDAEIPVTAYLPASLDKLLGIYLLARISMDLFVLNKAMQVFLLFIGAFTIVAAVMMALIQHDFRRLLGYHAVSQVGYMVLGIGTGSPIGIAGGLFHMLNHAIYKSCLFLSGGAVEFKTKTCDLDKLGGLVKFMPITFLTTLVASLSISGVPPFNGFVSKWMIYQGLVELGKTGDKLWVVWLAAAMFGSALTLASFMKLLHAIFLGQSRPESKSINEVSWQMWLPTAVLAILCIIFGVFANQVPLKFFILPAVGQVTFTGIWSAGLATILIIIGLLLGIFIFNLKGLRPNIRQDAPFTGTDAIDAQSRVSGTEFYNTIRELGLLGAIYKKAEGGFFDIYEQGKKITFSISGIFQYLHNGILPTYMVWYLLGMLGLFYILLFR
ncbi:MAG: proton-conducting transporter membrane subunit [Candidatus Omnitrophota bacterium]